MNYRRRKIGGSKNIVSAKNEKFNRESENAKGKSFTSMHKISKIYGLVLFWQIWILWRSPINEKESHRKMDTRKKLLINSFQAQCPFIVIAN